MSLSCLCKHEYEILHSRNSNCTYGRFKMIEIKFIHSKKYKCFIIKKTSICTGNMSLSHAIRRLFSTVFGIEISGLCPGYCMRVCWKLMEISEVNILETFVCFLSASIFPSQRMTHDAFSFCSPPSFYDYDFSLRSSKWLWQ